LPACYAIDDAFYVLRRQGRRAPDRVPRLQQFQGDDWVDVPRQSRPTSFAIVQSRWPFTTPPATRARHSTDAVALLPFAGAATRLISHAGASEIVDVEPTDQQ